MHNLLEGDYYDDNDMVALEKETLKIVLSSKEVQTIEDMLQEPS